MERVKLGARAEDADAERAARAFASAHVIEQAERGAGRFRRAFKLYLRAAKLGNADAQFRVGRSYATGTGTSEDDEKAYQWWLRAADAGHIGARRAVADALFWGTGIKRSRRRAARLYREGARSDPYFALSWARCLWEGHGVRRDAAEAVKWFKYVLRSEPLKWPVTEVYVYLGYAYEKGSGVRRNRAKSAHYFERAAKHGWSDAMVNLGWMLYNGVGVPADPRRAVRWYRRAAELEDAKGQLNLALAYLDGKGVRASADDAMRWLVASAGNGSKKAATLLRQLRH